MQNTENKFKAFRESSGMSMINFARYFEIPYKTVVKWENGERNCTPYLMALMEYKLRKEKILK